MGILLEDPWLRLVIMADSLEFAPGPIVARHASSEHHHLEGQEGTGAAREGDREAKDSCMEGCGVLPPQPPRAVISCFLGGGAL
jgi:hypothetical protein